MFLLETDILLASHSWFFLVPCPANKYTVYERPDLNIMDIFGPMLLDFSSWLYLSCTYEL